MKVIYVLIFIITTLILIFSTVVDEDEYYDRTYKENGFKESKKKFPLQIGNRKIYYLKVPNNLVYYKNVFQKNIIFLDDYHTYINEEIVCNQQKYIELLNFLKLFHKINKKVNLFIEVIRPSEHYQNYNDIIIENTSGFNSNNTITTIIDDPIFKQCFYKGKRCKNFIIYSTDIRISNDMLINYYNLEIKKDLDDDEIDNIILMTFKIPKNLYYVIFEFLDKNNKEPIKLKKYIHNNLKNEIYIYFKKLNKSFQKNILDFISKVYRPTINSNNFTAKYIIMFMDILTIMKILCVPKKEIVILYQGMHHNFYIRKYFDMYIKYDYKKRAENEFKHKNKCINVSKMDEIIF